MVIRASQSDLANLGFIIRAVQRWTWCCVLDRSLGADNGAHRSSLESSFQTDRCQSVSDVSLFHCQLL